MKAFRQDLLWCVSGQQNLSIQIGHRCHRMQTYGINV